MTAARALLAVGLTLATACGRVDSPPDETVSRCGTALADADAVLVEAARPRPELGEWHVDPVLGGCLARVSDHAALGAGDAQALPDRQAWNATQDRVLLRAGSVLDAERSIRA
jgi:hypothetical protein